MDENQRKEVEEMILDALKKAMDFQTRKLGDTPTDALQLTPKKYVDAKSISIPGGSSITGAATLAAGTNIVLTQSASIITISQSVLGAATSQIEVYTTSSTLNWVKPGNAKVVEVFLVGAGGGGGGGVANDNGAGGGGGGAMVYKKFAASVISSIETLVIGRGGDGGNQGPSGTQFGSVGGSSKFGTTVYLVATGGGGGESGAPDLSHGGAGGGGNGDWVQNGGPGGYGSLSGVASVGASTTSVISARGGGGGGGPTGDGGAGGGFTQNYVKAGGIGGTSCLGAGCTATPGFAGASTDPYLIFGGVGGGGGGGAQNISSTTGGNGGVGGFPGGGGGGGGFGSSNGQHGAGGNGADGMAVVITYF